MLPALIVVIWRPCHVTQYTQHRQVTVHRKDNRWCIEDEPTRANILSFLSIALLLVYAVLQLIRYEAVFHHKHQQVDAHL